MTSWLSSLLYSAVCSLLYTTRLFICQSDTFECCGSYVWHLSILALLTFFCLHFSLWLIAGSCCFEVFNLQRSSLTVSAELIHVVLAGILKVKCTCTHMFLEQYLDAAHFRKREPLSITAFMLPLPFPHEISCRLGYNRVRCPLISFRDLKNDYCMKNHRTRQADMLHASGEDAFNARWLSKL